MRALHIITGLNDGGAEAVLYRLRTSEKCNKHIVISLVNEGKYRSLLSAKNVQVHCIELTKGLSSFNKLVRLIKLIKAEWPDVVQTWMYHADLNGGGVARVAGVKNIYWGIHHSNLTPGDSKKVLFI